MPSGGCLTAARSEDHVRSLPSFFVLGPPRTGTTLLHEILSKRAVLPCPTKETCFFDVHFHRGTDWYLAHFPALRENRRIGEVAPTYFASAQARERIARLVPQAGVVCVFRNPVERVFSLYRLKRAYGMVPWGFEQAMVNDPERVESGRYATHLKAWQRALGSTQVLVTVYEDLQRDPQAYVDVLADFISVPRFPLSRLEARHMHGSENLTNPRNYYLTRTAFELAEWLKARRLDRVVATAKKASLAKLFLGGGAHFDGLSQDLALKLYELFRPEIEELETILNRDLSAWKSCSAQLEVLSGSCMRTGKSSSTRLPL